MMFSCGTRMAAAFAGVVGIAAAGPVGALAADTAKFATQAAGAGASVDHAVWDGLLKSHVKPAADGVNRVDYAAWKAKGHTPLKGYVKSLEAVKVTALARPEQFAFWANLYNAKTIDIVLDHYPVKSIREIDLEKSLFGFLKKSVGAGGPWKTPVVTVEGVKLSLDDIEHNILRAHFKDPRVHYAVNCASWGCPNLMAEAFTAARLEAQLDAGARAYINHPRGIKIAGGRVEASSIYEWFQADFGGSAAGVLEHARRYATAELKAALEGKSSIDRYDYDWRLNDVAR